MPARRFSNHQGREVPESEKRSQSRGTWGTCGLCRVAPWTGPGVPKGRKGKAEETGMECGFSLIITYHRSCLISFDKCTVGTQAAKSGGAGFLGLLALFLQLPYNSRRLPDGPAGKEPTCNVGDAGEAGSTPASGRSPGGGNVTHFRILVCRIPWTEEPGGPRALGSQSQTGLSD